VKVAPRLAFRRSVAVALVLGPIAAMIEPTAVRQIRQ
jgi:hypothetical protein